MLIGLIALVALGAVTQLGFIDQDDVLGQHCCRQHLTRSPPPSRHGDGGSCHRPADGTHSERAHGVGRTCRTDAGHPAAHRRVRADGTRRRSAGVRAHAPGRLFGGTGGGDVKLMAAFGTLLGPGQHRRRISLRRHRGRRPGTLSRARRGRVTVTMARTAQLVTGRSGKGGHRRGRAADTICLWSRPRGRGRVRNALALRKDGMRKWRSENGAALLEAALTFPPAAGHHRHPRVRACLPDLAGAHQRGA